MTPEGEKIRRIKKTLDDDNEEIQDLYGSLGLSHPLASQHQRQTITEPIQPMKSSSDLLRSLALQDRPGIANQPDPSRRGSDHSTSSSTWWVGSMTSSFSRAARAVMDMSPPSKGASTFEEVARQFTGVGLGLAKGGEGVRKVKSNWELDRTRRADSDCPPQEQRSPIPRFISERPARHMPNDSLGSFFQPPPPPIDDDAFGYSPLPQDYETQCEDDNIVYSALDMYHEGSLGSSHSRTSSERGIDELILAVGDSASSSVSMGGIGKKILMNAVDYDEDLENLESPTRSHFILPLVDVERIPGESSTAVSTPPSEPQEPVPPPQSKPKLKYGDRATKLRMAQSTPALRQSKATQSSWLDYLPVGLRSKPPVAAPPVPKLPPGPLKISASRIVAPTVSPISPVVCDSASADAQDLPAVPPAMGGYSWEADKPLTLRLKASLATIKATIGLPDPPSSDSTSPVLSPRVDWTEQGEQFARWTRKNEVAAGDTPRATPPAVARLRESSGQTISIDYTKSFFYKPPTPPHPGAAAPPSEPSQSTPSKAPNPVARRQRSIKSLRQNLLLPTAPPVPEVPTQFAQDPPTPPEIVITTSITPPRATPALVISSPGTCDAGLPPRKLVLEGEDWDTKDEGGRPGEWGRRRKPKKKTLKKKPSLRSKRSNESMSDF